MILKIFEELSKNYLSESPLITIPEVTHIPRKGEYIMVNDKTYRVENLMYKFSPPYICVMGVMDVSKSKSKPI